MAIQVPDGVCVKFDENKPRTDLIPADVLEDVAQVFTYGANKYSARNWEQPVAWGRLYGAACRHLFAFWRGEDRDCESGLSHLAHALACVMMLLWHTKNFKDGDDRTGKKKPDLVRNAGAIRQQATSAFSGTR